MFYYDVWRINWNTCSHCIPLEKGVDNEAIHEEIFSIYGENSIALCGVQKRTKSLAEGNHSLFDKERVGRPVRSN